MRRIRWNLRLRDEAGKEHDRDIFAADEATARKRAVAKEKGAMGRTMAEREYGAIDVLSCVQSPT